MKVCETALGRFALQRLPVSRDETLRAWDAADELLLAYVAAELLPSFTRRAEQKILLVNDQFGALAVALHKYAPQSWSDSFLTYKATQMNLALNKLPDSVAYLPSTEEPQGDFDGVLLKVPKSLALLEDQLIRLKPHLLPQTRIIAAGMTRHIHTSTLQLFEKILGSTATSLARKKARLIFTRYEKTEPQPSPYPTSFYDKTWDIHLSNQAGVFAREKLDIGARFMLEQFQHLPQARQVIDLGCGNGVLGLVAQRQQPQAQLLFVDESYMAVASARENYQQAFGHQLADFVVGDILDGLQKKAVDLILCNPPFHQQHVIDDQVAWEMFRQSHQQLAAGGELWVVGNRHLHYHSKLKRLFGRCQQIASHKKFVVLAATR